MCWTMFVFIYSNFYIMDNETDQNFFFCCFNISIKNKYFNFSILSFFKDNIFALKIFFEYINQKSFFPFKVSIHLKDNAMATKSNFEKITEIKLKQMFQMFLTNNKSENIKWLFDQKICQLTTLAIFFCSNEMLDFNFR